MKENILPREAVNDNNRVALRVRSADNVSTGNLKAVTLPTRWSNEAYLFTAKSTYVVLNT